VEVLRRLDDDSAWFARSMPAQVKHSGLKPWVRWSLTTMSMARALSSGPILSHAMSPIGVSASPKRWKAAQTSPFTRTRVSTGAPEAGPCLPPRRTSKLAPSPASKASSGRAAVVERRDGDATDAALDQPAQQKRRIARRAEARVVGSVGEHERPAPAVAGNAADRALDVEKGRRHRRAHRPDLAPERRGERLGPGAVAVGNDQHAHATSGVSPQGNPCASETDTIRPCPRVRTCGRPGRAPARACRKMPIIRQSCSAIVGRIRPASVPSTMRHKSRARSVTSTCGYSL